MWISCFAGFSGFELLTKDKKVIGVRTGSRGIDKKGEKKPNFEEGIEIHAKLTVLAEGPRGTLTKQATTSLGLQGRNPQTYALGVKELWEIPEGRMKKGHVIHSMGWPLDEETFGGSFVYALDETKVAVGFVTGLDNPDPAIDTHHELQRFKTHPHMKPLFEGGKLLHYGAKTIPEGGWYSIPTCYSDGLLIAGDSASFLNSMRLKGIHLAIKSGMLAAETAMEAIHAHDFSTKTLSLFEQKVKESWIHEELFPIRNAHQGFKGGLYGGMFNVGLQMFTHGMGFHDPVLIKEDHEYRRKKGKDRYKDLVFDGKLTFDKVTDVFASQTKHELDQPTHLRVADRNICSTRCVKEFGAPCQRFCPANVYEIISMDKGKPELLLHPENCVHCKTCDIADPYQIITWVPPEGGDGPNYVDM